MILQGTQMKKLTHALAATAIASSVIMSPSLVGSIWASPQNPTATELATSFEKMAEDTKIAAEKTRIAVMSREKATKEKPIIAKAIKQQIEKNKKAEIARKKKIEEIRKKAIAKKKAEIAAAKKKAAEEKARQEREAARQRAEQARQAAAAAQEQQAQQEYTVVTTTSQNSANTSSTSNSLSTATTSNSSRNVSTTSGNTKKALSNGTKKYAPVTISGESSARAKQAIEFALSKRGIPYRWGGTTDAGYDCSGLVQAAYRSAGISLPRVASAQLNVGTPVSRSQLQPGDLVGFYGGGHIGIYIGNGYYVHAPRTGDVVKVAKLPTLWKATRVA